MKRRTPERPRCLCGRAFAARAPFGRRMLWLRRGAAELTVLGSGPSRWAGPSPTACSLLRRLRRYPRKKPSAAAYELSMTRWRNPSGLPLASAGWLEAHHRAKLSERRIFAERLAVYKPSRVVDLGCGTGLWLELLNDVLEPGCEVIGVDTDEGSLAEARRRSAGWPRPVTFERLDIEAEPERVPAADMTLAFNIFPYLKAPAELLSIIADRRGTLAVRQYDGAALRFGPMEPRRRDLIESSLRASVGSSSQFRHYDLDRAFELLAKSSFKRKELGFELFSRTAPFPEEFLAYYEGTLNWTLDLLSEAAADALTTWLDQPSNGGAARYFFEVDLTAILS